MPSDTMWREMLGQGAALAAALPVLREEVRGLPERAEGTTVWAGGCGDSYFAALAAKDAFRELGIPYRAASALALAHEEPLGPMQGDTVYLLSVSGETLRTVEAAERLRQRGVATIAVTATNGSSLELACASSLTLPYRSLSRATPHTGDYLISLLALVLVAECAQPTPFASLEVWLGDWEDSWESTCHAASRLAGEWRLRGNLYLLGGLGDEGTALYGAAKFHEAGGWPAMAAETENFLHGMNYLPGPEDLVLVLGGAHRGAKRAVEIAEALRAQCGTFAVLDRSRCPEEGTATGDVLRLSGGVPIFAFQAAIFLQALCWFSVSPRIRDLEEPLAERPDGEVRQAVQRRLLKEARLYL